MEREGEREIERRESGREKGRERKEGRERGERDTIFIVDVINSTTLAMGYYNRHMNGPPQHDNRDPNINNYKSKPITLTYHDQCLQNTIFIHGLYRELNEVDQ